MPQQGTVSSDESTHLLNRVYTLIFTTAPVLSPLLSTFKFVLSLWTHPVIVSSPAERQVFLATWKDIPNDNESQFQIKDCHLNSGEWKEQRAEGALAEEHITT